MLAHDPDRLAGHLVRIRRLGWPLTRSLRRTVTETLARRGVTVRNPRAPASVLLLALLVSELPASDLATAGGRP